MVLIFSINAVSTAHHYNRKNNKVLQKTLARIHKGEMGPINHHRLVPPKPHTSPGDQPFDRADSLLVAWGASYTSGISNANDISSAICVDPQDRSVYVVGTSNSVSTGYDYLVIKYNNKGDTVWTRRYDGAAHADDYAVTAALGPSGNLYVTGFSMDADSVFDYMTVKYDPSGSLLWMQTYDGTGHSDDTPSDLAIDAAENVYVTGSSVGTDSMYDIATVKYTPSGASQWVVRYSSPLQEDNIAVEMMLDNSRNICIAGNSVDANGNSQYVILKYNGSGTQLWSAVPTNGTNQSSEIVGIATDVFRNIAVTGRSLTDLNDYNYYTLEYDQAGTKLWAVQFDGIDNQDDEAAGVVFDSQGNVYVTGASIGLDGTYDYVTIKYSATGSRKWLKRFTSILGDDLPSLITIDPYDNIYVSGTSANIGISYDIATVKYNASGDQQWVAFYNSPSNGYDYPTSLQLDSSVNIYICGVTANHGINSISTFKYVQFAGLYFDNTNISFPSTELGCGVSDTIVATNARPQPITITSIVTPFNDYIISPLRATIPAMGSQAFVVTFAPLGSGTITDTIEFNTDAPGTNPEIQVSGIATGSGTMVNVSATLGTGWQLVSLPITVNCPIMVSNLQTFRYSNGYVQENTMKNGVGYWRKLSYPDISFTGFSQTAETLNVNAKWNLLGSMAFPIPISQIQTVPQNILTSEIYGYSGTGYFIADTIYPCRAYWAKVSQAGQIIMSNSFAAIPKRFSGEILSENSVLTLTDAAGKTQQLFVSANTGSIGNYELPPPPPKGVFDARFASGKYLETARTGTSTELPIAISSARYPLQISWDIKPAMPHVALRINSNDLPLSGQGNTSVQSGSSIEVVARGNGQVPDRYSLSQNYPNPFNPTTTIRYDLPKDGFVSLKVIDLLGQEVTTLVSKQQNAGAYSVQFDARNVSSGLYFYRLSAGDFTTIKKMAVIK
ncbi:MAG: T9SS type A sorting domain-containing protein [Bacteroidota bacterium]